MYVILLYPFTVWMKRKSNLDFDKLLIVNRELACMKKVTTAVNGYGCGMEGKP